MRKYRVFKQTLDRFACVKLVLFIYLTYSCSISSGTQALRRSCSSPGSDRIAPIRNHLEMRIWDEVLPRSRDISRKCRAFILYTVLVLSSSIEEHHEIKAGPNITTASCAVLFLLHTGEDRPEQAKSAYLQGLGWTVITHRFSLHPKLVRRASRVPKILPVLFFPFTKDVLYSDTKYIHEMNHVEASWLAKMFLRDAHFGIARHPVTSSLLEEHEAILASKRGEAIVDSSETLALQVLRLDYTLTKREKQTFGVEGRIHARRLRGVGTSSQFDATWFEEFNAGSDRDQIAFYAAAARMGMELYETSDCRTFSTTHVDGQHRCRTFTSKQDKNFRMVIHCDLDSIISWGLNRGAMHVQVVH